MQLKAAGGFGSACWMADGKPGIGHAHMRRWDITPFASALHDRHKPSPEAQRACTAAAHTNLSRSEDQKPCTGFSCLSCVCAGERAAGRPQNHAPLCARACGQPGAADQRQVVHAGALLGGRAPHLQVSATSLVVNLLTAEGWYLGGAETWLCMGLAQQSDYSCSQILQPETWQPWQQKDTAQDLCKVYLKLVRQCVYLPAGR